MERSTIHLLHKRGKSQREIASELGRSLPALRAPILEDRQNRSPLFSPEGRRARALVAPGRTPPATNAMLLKPLRLLFRSNIRRDACSICSLGVA
jgi:hypothetical protein